MQTSVKDMINELQYCFDYYESKKDHLIQYDKSEYDKTIELFNIISMHDDFINSYMRLIKESIYFEEKTINDIKIIND